ncbi:MAG: TRAP transporter large permease [Mycobacterium sp.]
MTAGLVVLGVVALLMVRVPVAFALLGPSLVYFLFTPLTNTNVVVQKLVSSLDTFTLVAVPMFLLLGGIANVSGVSERLFAFAEVIMGRVRFALGYVNILVSFVFSWMSGTATADVAATGRIQVPQMLRRGYSRDFTLGTTATTSIIGAIMPPSLPAVVYAVTAGVSLGGMLIAGVLPAILITVMLTIGVFVYSLRHKDAELAEQPQRSRREKAGVLLRALPALMTPPIIIGGILFGFFTPSEAAAIAVGYLAVLGFVYRTLTVRLLMRVLGSAAAVSGSVLLIIAASAVFGQVLTLERVPQLLGSWMTSLSENPLVFLLLVAALLLLVGLFLEPTAGTLIMVPVLAPVASQYGVDPLHFGVIVILTLVIGLVTPPVGLVSYVLSSATGQPVGAVFRGAVLFLPWLIAALLLIVFFPPIVTFLPGLLAP